MAGRVTQVTVEAVIASTSSTVRTTQVAVEAVISPASAVVRVTQATVEAVIAPTSQNLVVSQAFVEAARTGDPNLAVSQSGIEVLRAPDPSEVDLLISQAGIEVAWEVPKGTFTLNAAIVIRRTYGTKSVFYGYSGAPIVIKTPNQGQPQEIVIPGCDLTITGSPITITWDVWQSHFQWAVDKKEIIYIRRDSLTGLAIWSDDPQKEETDAGNNATGMQWHFTGSYTETARSGRYVLTVKPAKGNATLYASEIHFTLSVPGDGPGMTVDAVIKRTQVSSFAVAAFKAAAAPGVGSGAGATELRSIVLSHQPAPSSWIESGWVDPSLTTTRILVDATLFVWGLGAFVTYATIGATPTSSFSVEAVKIEESGGVITYGGDFPADALIGPHTGLFVTDSVVFAPVYATFGVDSYVASVGYISAFISGFACVWSTPGDVVPISATETLAFFTPHPSGPLHFEIQLDKVATFDGPDLFTTKSHENLAGWEYWDGSAWQALTIAGMPSGGPEARYTIQTPLSTGLWYRRVRAGVI